MTAARLGARQKAADASGWRRTPQELSEYRSDIRNERNDGAANGEKSAAAITSVLNCENDRNFAATAKAPARSAAERRRLR
jgi:hypothetical protein